MVAYRSSLENKTKMNLQLIFNKNSPLVELKLEFNMLGVAKRLVKIVIHLKKLIFLFA
jgi:hypothetical protein